MDVCMFSAKRYDRESFDANNDGRHRLTYVDVRLDAASACSTGALRSSLTKAHTAAPGVARLAVAASSRTST